MAQTSDKADRADNGDKVEKTEKVGLLRRALSRLASSHEEQVAAELQETVQKSGYNPVGRCADRQRVKLRGTLRTVTLSPRAGTPTLEAELYDGSGTVTLVWLGRRRIVGVEPGRDIMVSGRIAVHDNRRIMYNPSYELCPMGAS
jgi:hypothetical protein